VWLIVGLPALLGLLVSVAVLAVLAAAVWAIADACRHSEAAWNRIGHSRPLWIVLLIGGWMLSGIAGLVLALVYLAAIRPRLLAAARPRPIPRRAPPQQHRLALRASDADRDHAGAWLRHHFSVGRLTYDELLQRLDEAYTARTVGDLERSLRELPQW
jgi:hypothetical protein